MTTTEAKIKQWAERLSQDDLILISNALNEILNGPGAIEEWEFQTRTGIERTDAIALQRDLNTVLESLKNLNVSH